MIGANAPVELDSWVVSDTFERAASVEGITCTSDEWVLSQMMILMKIRKW